MVRTERWRVLLATTLLGVVLLAAPAHAQDGSSSTTDPTTTSTAPDGATTSEPPPSSTTTTVAPTTTTTTAAPPPAVPNPVLAGPVAAKSGTKGHPLAAATDPIDAAGYVEQELFMQGTATAHAQAGQWGADGRWAVSDLAQIPYRTRILVRRPTDPAKFNGTVVVSWLNVNGAFESDPEWSQVGDELMREGAVFVGVSAQMLGIDGPLGARRWDPDRYSDLDLSADSLSYDVFSQAGQAIRSPKGLDPLAGLSRTRRLIASGQSQSAQRLVTYLNAFQPTTHMFDGFFLVSRFRGAAPIGRALLPAQGVLDPDGADPDHPFLADPLAALVSGPAQALVRADTDVPVFVVVTETEAGQDTSVRRADSALFRTWEVAGASHIDSTATTAIVTQLKRDFPRIPLGQLDCPDPNVFPARYALRAAVRSLSTWVAGGTAPATAPPLARDPKTGALVRDADGNAVGGLRLPEIDVPAARFGGESRAQGYCGLTGSTVPFAASKLAARYPTTQAYADAVAASADAAVRAGHLLPEDAAEIVAAARGGATQAVIADTAAASATAAAAAGHTTGSATPPRSGTAAPADPAVSAASASKATTADRGWLATTGRDLITPVLIGLLLILNGRVVLTIAHQRRGTR
jgi:hypothetical protein